VQELTLHLHPHLLVQHVPLVPTVLLAQLLARLAQPAPTHCQDLVVAPLVPQVTIVLREHLRVPIVPLVSIRRRRDLRRVLLVLWAHIALRTLLNRVRHVTPARIHRVQELHLVQSVLQEHTLRLLDRTVVVRVVRLAHTLVVFKVLLVQVVWRVLTQVLQVVLLVQLVQREAIVGQPGPPLPRNVQAGPIAPAEHRVVQLVQPATMLLLDRVHVRYVLRVPIRLLVHYLVLHVKQDTILQLLEVVVVRHVRLVNIRQAQDLHHAQIAPREHTPVIQGLHHARVAQLDRIHRLLHRVVLLVRPAPTCHPR